MKRVFMSMALVGAILVLSGCCGGGGCYVQPTSCCSTCTTCMVNTCSTCGYGYGYNDWY